MTLQGRLTRPFRVSWNIWASRFIPMTPFAGRRRLRFSFFFGRAQVLLGGIGQGSAIGNRVTGCCSLQRGWSRCDRARLTSDPWSGLVAQLVRARA